MIREIPEGNYCLYRHVRPDKNEVFYIGIGRDSYRPKKKSNRSDWWKKIVAKNNGEYKIDVLFENISKEFAIEKEKEFIQLYGRMDLGLGTLCNMTDGGDGTGNHIITDEMRERMRKNGKERVITQETRDNISKALTGRKIPSDIVEKVANSLRGKKASDQARLNQSIAQKKRHKENPHSLETREKQRVASTGRVFSEESRKKMSLAQAGEKNPHFKGYILRIDEESGEVNGRFVSVTTAYKDSKMTYYKIMDVINGKLKSYNGYIFRYE